MKVLLCGGAGYIGTHVALEFIRRGDQVGILDNFSSGLRENVRPEVQLYEGSILDKLLTCNSSNYELPKRKITKKTQYTCF